MFGQNFATLVSFGNPARRERLLQYVTGNKTIVGVIDTIPGTYTTAGSVIIMKVQADTKKPPTPEMVTINAWRLTCEWRSMIYRSLRRSSGMLQHCESALLGLGSWIALRADHTTPHTLNLTLCIVLLSLLRCFQQSLCGCECKHGA